MKKALQIILLLFISIFSGEIINAQTWNTIGNTGLTTSNFLGTTDSKDLILKVNNTERGRLLSASGAWRFGNAINFAKIDSAGKLTFTGTGAYQVAGNKYAFQYTGNPNYGLFFNSTSVQYEFRNGSAVSVFSVNANTGASVFSGTLKVGAYTLPVTDGTSGQALTTNGAGVVNWSTLSGGSGANTTLSNLAATTAVNQSLLPGTTNSVDIGSPTTLWRNAYFRGDALINSLTFGKGGGNINTNIAIGYYSLNANTTGNYNTATGYDALSLNTIGGENTANGYDALSLNTTGGENTAYGYQALYSNTTGSNNAANGSYSLSLNTTGSNNTASGTLALYGNTTGSNNVANGYNALYSNTTGGDNTAHGFDALYFNTTGSNNTANGNQALYSNITGSNNAANGSYSLSLNTTGSNNTALGFEVLASNTTGGNNTSEGFEALYYNSTGASNTANGTQALNSNTSGGNNSAVGYDALYSNTTGSYNTSLGYAAYPIDGTVNNYTGIGYNVGTTASASNEVEIGNTSVSVIRGEVNFSTYSDKRIKNNIQQNVPGLAFITKLKPVTYKLDIHKENEMIYAGKTIAGKTDKEVDFAGKYDLEKKQMTGFLAQDVEAAAESIHYDFSGVVKPQNDHDLYSLRYSDFVVPLVKAVQELSSQNDSLKQTNQVLNYKLDALTERLNKVENTISQSNSSSAIIQSNNNTNIVLNANDAARLDQNAPNPFNSNTIIKYYLPSQTGNAQMVITDANGVTIKTITLNNKGAGQVNITAGTLSSGSYFYSLLVDGKKIDTKQMVLTK